MKKLITILYVFTNAEWKMRNITALGNDGKPYRFIQYHDWSFIRFAWFVIKSKHFWREIGTVYDKC